MSRSIIWNCINRNGGFYQYLRYSRKRTYKEIEENKEDLVREVNILIGINFFNDIKNASDELE